MTLDSQRRSDLAPKRDWTRWRRALSGGGLAAVAVLLVLFYWDQTAFEEWKRTANPILFFGLLGVLPAFGVPTTPFFLLAGAIFNPWVAWVGSAIGVASNNILCWLIAQSWMRQALERLLARFGYDVPRVERGKAIRIALVVKLAPGLPTVLKNYVMAMSGLEFRFYLGISWGVTMLYATAFILLGESFMEQDIRSALPALAALVFVGLLFFVVRRRLAAKGEAPGDASKG